MPIVTKEDAAKGCGGFCALLILVTIITTLASCKAPTSNEQLVIHYLDGKQVVNGPATMVVNPFRELERRPKIKLISYEYVRIKNTLTGEVRVEGGPQNFFLTAYEEASEDQRKIVLKTNQWVRLVDKLTGEERIEVGTKNVMPGYYEEMVGDIQSASFINRETVVIIRNRIDGTVRLHDTPGVFVPAPFEEVVETRNRIALLPHEVMVLRNAHGQFSVKEGESFFLGPWDEMVTFEWSAFSEPQEGQQQVISKTQVSRIDTRVRRFFYQYDIRTSDNVPMLIEGSIFWRAVNVSKLVYVTGDPAGDVWYRSRSVLTSAVSRVGFQDFTKNFTNIIKAAFAAAASDEFYLERGIEMKEVEVTKYECTDADIAITLQAIIDATTDRINQLEKQRAQNSVQTEKLKADIELERERTSLINTQGKNELLVARLNGEAEGVLLANQATSFIDGLNESLPDVELRLRLYKLYAELETKLARTESLADSHATLFLNTEDLGLKFSYSDYFGHDEL